MNDDLPFWCLTCGVTMANSNGGQCDECEALLALHSRFTREARQAQNVLNVLGPVLTAKRALADQRWEERNRKELGAFHAREAPVS